MLTLVRSGLQLVKSVRRLLHQENPWGLLAPHPFLLLVVLSYRLSPLYNHPLDAPRSNRPVPLELSHYPPSLLFMATVFSIKSDFVAAPFS